MTDTIDAVTADEVVDQQQLAEQLLAQAKAQGVDLVGPGGLLNQITKRVLESALEAEMSEHLGYDKHEVVGRDGGNSGGGGMIVTTSNSQRPVEQRLTALFNAQGQELWRYAKCRAPTDSAGDIAADVFLVAWRHGDDVQGDALP